MNTRTAVRLETHLSCLITCRTQPCSSCHRHRSHLNVQLWYVCLRVFLNFPRVSHIPTRAKHSGDYAWCDHMCLLLPPQRMMQQSKPVFSRKHWERRPALLTMWHLYLNTEVNFYCVNEKNHQQEQIKMQAIPSYLWLCVFVFIDYAGTRIQDRFPTKLPRCTTELKFSDSSFT